VNWFVFMVCTIIFIPILLNIDWSPPKRRRRSPRLDEMWMYEDDLEELDE